MELTQLYNYVINVSGQFLLGSTLELTKDIFISMVKNSVRDLNKYQPYSNLNLSVTANFQGRFEYHASFLNLLPEAVVEVIPVSGAYPFYPYQYIKDPWLFEINRIALPIRYEKPYLYAPLAGVYNAMSIHYHWLRQQTAITGLTGAGIELSFTESTYGANQFLVAMALLFEDDSNFTATVSGDTILFTAKANGVTFTPPLSGNTGWTMTVVSVGTVSSPMSVSFTITDIADYSLTAKYFVLASPTVKYYYWINLNNTAVDPAVGGYFLDFIDETKNSHFFDLCTARFKKALGGSRKSFVLTNLPITNDGGQLYSEGVEEEKTALENLKLNSYGFYAWK